MTAPTSLSSEEFSFFADFLRTRSAISLAPGKEYLIESRLAPLARERGHANVSAFIGELRRPGPDPRICDRAVQAMTTNETSWFRDAHPFEAFRTVILPEVMKANAAGRRLSVWSAACSTGQELYSIAMTIAQYAPSVAQWDLRLTGTDLSQDVVRRAQAGRYSQLEINRGLPAPMLLSFFTRDGRDYVVDEKLRRWCSFSVMNLANPWPPGPKVDVVFLRNVLIYFDVPVRQRILAEVRRRLAPGGFLVLGAAEAATGVGPGFTQVRLPHTTVYRAE